MDSKKIIESLVKIANNQQKIIHKLAQQQEVSTFTPGKHQELGNGPVTGTPAGQVTHKDPQQAIVEALGANFAKLLSDLSVQRNTVTLTFLPGKGTQPNYDFIRGVVQKLQNSNVLMGGPYSIRVAGWTAG